MMVTEHRFRLWQWLWFSDYIFWYGLYFDYYHAHLTFSWTIWCSGQCRLLAVLYYCLLLWLFYLRSASERRRRPIFLHCIKRILDTFQITLQHNTAADDRLPACDWLAKLRLPATLRCAQPPPPSAMAHNVRFQETMGMAHIVRIPAAVTSRDSTLCISCTRHRRNIPRRNSSHFIPPSYSVHRFVIMHAANLVCSHPFLPSSIATVAGQMPCGPAEEL